MGHEHTAGPWRREDRHNATILAPDGHIIAEVFHDDCAEEGVALDRYGADIALIAAAPELLAALEGIVKMCQEDGYADEILEGELEAIAKARGQVEAQAG